MGMATRCVRLCKADIHGANPLKIHEMYLH